MKDRLIRHATMHLRVNELTFLVDPVLSPAGSRPAIFNTPNQRANPLVELPLQTDELFNVHGILITHTHGDHLDEMAMTLLDKDLPIFCQPADTDKLIAAKFGNVISVEKSVVWKGVKIIRTSGRHGSWLLAKILGPVSGFVLQADHEPITYITGDTIWCPQVESALNNYKPEVIIAYSGAARINYGNPITMDTSDLYQVCTKAPQAKVVAVHLEAYNHCLLTRNQLREFINDNQLTNLLVPNDGETICF